MGGREGRKLAGVVRRLMESAMEEELLEQLRAGRYRRSGLRRGYRNGYRHRGLLTELGMLEHLRVPRLPACCFRCCCRTGNGVRNLIFRASTMSDPFG